MNNYLKIWKHLTCILEVILKYIFKILTRLNQGFMHQKVVLHKSFENLHLIHNYMSV